MKHTALTMCLLIAVCLTGCAGYHMPTVSNNNPAEMSSQTLCYRHAAATGRSQALAGEIARRRLDCGAILEDDPLYKGR